MQTAQLRDSQEKQNSNSQAGGTRSDEIATTSSTRHRDNLNLYPEAQNSLRYAGLSRDKMLRHVGSERFRRVHVQRLLQKTKHTTTVYTTAADASAQYSGFPTSSSVTQKNSLSLSLSRSLSREPDKRDRLGVEESERAAAHSQQSPPRMRRKARAPGYPCCQATRLDLWV